jgi:DNA-binding transcriptional MerR regulator
MQTNPKPTGIPETITTEEAARILHCSAHTLRVWACYGKGPIQPVRVSRRLLWRVDDLKRVLSAGA